MVNVVVMSNTPIIPSPRIVKVMPISANPPKRNREMRHAEGKSKKSVTPALRNDQPSIGKMPGVHNDRAAPSPSKPPKTMPMVPVNNSPRLNSTMASNSNATEAEETKHFHGT